MHNRQVGVAAVVLLASTLAAGCSSPSTPPPSGPATLIEVPANPEPETATTREEQTGAPSPTAAEAPDTTTGEPNSVTPSASTAPGSTAASSPTPSATSAPSGSSTPSVPTGSSQPSTNPSTPGTGTSTAASPSARTPGTRHDLLAAGSPVALSTLVNELNLVSDKLSNTVSEDGDAIDREYEPSWAKARSAGLTITAVLGEDDLASGMQPEQPTSAYLVNVSQGNAQWCLVDVNLLPDGTRTGTEETKRATNFFPYYAAYNGSCTQQPFLTAYFQ